jgi:uncharacterized protein YoxC
MQAAAQKAGVSIKAIDGEEASATMERLNDAMTEFKNNAMEGIEDKLNGIREGLATTNTTINDATDAVKDGAQAWSEYNDQ